MARTRRKAREAALQALYKIEVAKSPIATAVQEMQEHAEMTPELVDYAQALIVGVRSNQPHLDRQIAPLLTGYDYERLAVVDRNVMRIAAYELFFVPGVPPAVTIDEAIEIARKYSTVESGKFVNGVLDALLRQSPKADWDPAVAPAEFAEEKGEDVPVEVVEETIDADSDEARKLARAAGWKLRS